jgi:hypothetical protein
MDRPPSRPEGERHPTLDTFERVLNHGVIVDVERRRRSRVDADAKTALALVDVDAGSQASTHSIFLDDTWKTWRED